MDVYESDMHAFDMMKPKLEISKNAVLKFNKHFEYALEHYFAENGNNSVMSGRRNCGTADGNLKNKSF